MDIPLKSTCLFKFLRARTVLFAITFVLAGLVDLLTAKAANKNVWISDPVDTQASAQEMATCVGNTVTFTATTSWPDGSTWSWSGATLQSSVYPNSTANQTFGTAGGPFSVTSTYNAETSYAANVTVFEAASLVPDKGTLGSPGPPPIYVIAIGNGNVTVSAAANPAAAASALPACWTLTTDSSRATIVDKLTATVDTDTPLAGATITATAGSSSKAVKIQVNCPDESITMTDRYCCGALVIYGGQAHYCYTSASNALWWGESVSLTSNSCPPQPIRTGPVIQLNGNPINCVYDEITNPCPIPANNCQTVTSQTATVGTSQTSLTCSYLHTQTITVTYGIGGHGTVTTSVGRSGYTGDSTSCNF